MEFAAILHGSQPSDWLNTIEDEKQKKRYKGLLDGGISEEQIIERSLDEYAKQLEQNSLPQLEQNSLPRSLKSFTFKEYKEKLMDEIAETLCGKNPISVEEKSLIEQGLASYKYIVTALTGIICVKYGWDVGVITPIVAITLHWAVKVNLYTWCDLQGYSQNEGNHVSQDKIGNQ